MNIADTTKNLTANQAATLIALKELTKGFDKSYREAAEFGGKGAVLASLENKGLIERPNGISQSYGWEARRYRLTTRGSLVAGRASRQG